MSMIARVMKVISKQNKVITLHAAALTCAEHLKIITICIIRHEPFVRVFYIFREM